MAKRHSRLTSLTHSNKPASARFWWTSTRRAQPHFSSALAPAAEFELELDELTDAGFKRNIRESDYPGLDILPSNLAYRNFDIALDRMRKSRKQLRWLLQDLGVDYDFIVLDCPPNITLLSENVFRASNMILVPVIPTPLSERTLEQLFAFFKEVELPTEMVVPFFSMAQKRSRIHQETIAHLPERYPMFLRTVIPLLSRSRRWDFAECLSWLMGPNSVARSFQRTGRRS